MRLKLSVHPLFLAFFIYYIFIGRVLEFVLITISAVVHELGHYFVADGLGYRLNRIVLMPFGAVVKGNIDGLKIKDELKIAIAGPLVNIAIALFFVALWWFIPSVYAFTDTIVYTNLSLGLVNLLPCYPLDGGRIAYSVLSQKYNKKIAKKTCKILGFSLSAILLLMFLLTIIKNNVNINFSLLFFSLFVLSGTTMKEEKAVYQKIFQNVNREKLERGMPIYSQAVSENITVKKLIKLLEPDSLNIVEVYSENKKVATLNDSQIHKVIEKSNIYSTLKEVLKE